MFVVGNFLIAVATILDIILRLMYWLILIRALVSWVNPDPYNPIVQFLYRTTEPILQPIRRFMPPMAIDISPIVAFFGIIFLNVFLVTSISEIGNRFKYQSNPQKLKQVEFIDVKDKDVTEDAASFMRR